MYAFGAHVENGGRWLRFGLALLVFAILALVTLASCQSSKSHNPHGFTTNSDTTANGSNAARTLSIEQAVANVQVYEPPVELFQFQW